MLNVVLLEIDSELTDAPVCISDIPPHACTSRFYLSGLSQKHGSRESVTRWCVWWIEYFEKGQALYIMTIGLNLLKYEDGYLCK